MLRRLRRAPPISDNPHDPGLNSYPELFQLKHSGTYYGTVKREGSSVV